MSIMSGSSLPERIDPYRFADAGRDVSGEVRLGGMERLAASLSRVDAGAVARVGLRFGVDEEGIKFIRGRIEAEVNLICQRCLGEFAYPVEAEVSLGLVRSEAQAERLPERYDPLILDEDLLSLRDLVEEELILALPLVPKHAEACLPEREVAEEEQGQEVEKVNPFAVLSKLKTNE